MADSDNFYSNVISPETPSSDIDAKTLDGASLSTDTTLSGDSDTAIPTEKATKTYVDNATADYDNAFTIDGSYNVTTAAGMVVTEDLDVSDTTDASDKDTGSIVTEGGIGVEKKIHAGTDITADNQLISAVATGTAPIAVSSTTKVSSLNVDQVDGCDVEDSDSLGTSDVKIPTQGNVKAYVDDTAGQRYGVYRNALINGDMMISQRGTSFAAIATNAYSLDRWRYSKSGTMVHTITQDSDVPSSTVFKYSLKVDCTTVDSSIAAGDYCFLRQNIEGYNFAPYVGQTATLSFWVKSTKIGTFCVSFKNFGSDRAYVAEYTVSASDTWEQKTISLDFDYSGGTWDYENSVGLSISWAIAMGSTYHTTASAWQSGNYLSTSNQVNACDSTSNNFLLTGVQLNLGSTALPFEHLDFGTSLARCQRYLVKFAQDTQNTVLVGGFFETTSSTSAAGTSEFPVEMRDDPTVVTTGTASDYQLRTLGGAAKVCTSVPNSGGVSKKSFILNAYGSSLSGLYKFVSNATTGTEVFVIFDAEL